MAEAMRGDGTVYRQKGSRFLWLQYYVNGERIRESSNTDSPKEAAKLLRQKLVSIDNGELSPAKIPLAQLYDSLERDYLINNRKDLVNLKSRWTKHLQPIFGENCASDIHAETIAVYIARRLGSGASNASVNRELAVLKRMYKLAIKSGRLKVGQQPYIEMLKERNVRKGFVRDEQYEALARETGKIGLWLRAMFELAYVYGFRKSELLKMRVRQVNLIEHTITLDPEDTKNAESRTVEMTGREKAFELLRQCCAGKQSGDHVFTRAPHAGGVLLKYPNSRFWWTQLSINGKSVRESTKLEDRTAAGEILSQRITASMSERKERPIYDFRDDWTAATEAADCSGLLFHDLRRTGVRNMRRSGVSEKVAMRISGHKTRSVFERYNIIDPTDLGEAARKMEEASKERQRQALQREMFTGIEKPNISTSEKRLN